MSNVGETEAAVSLELKAVVQRCEKKERGADVDYISGEGTTLEGAAELHDEFLPLAGEELFADVFDFLRGCHSAFFNAVREHIPVAEATSSLYRYGGPSLKAWLT